jgi:hypothetical protein
VLEALPTVPLDSELLAVLSIGLPIGLGTYWAWVNRDWAARTKTIGLSGATAGALIGAWLGFNAGAGLMAVITTIIGAAVGANLTVIGLDIAWERQIHDRFAASAKEALKPHAATG